MAYPHSYISGFELTCYVSLGVSYVSIAPGECVGIDGLLYKRTTAQGALVINEGNVGNANGIASALQTGYWYPVFLIESGGTLAGWVGSRNTTSTGTLPSGYTAVRRIGWAKTWHSVADFVPSTMFTDQHGRREVRWLTDINIETSHEFAPSSFGLVGIGFTSKDYSTQLPPDCRRGIFNFRASATGANGSIYYQYSNVPPYDTMDIQVALLVVGDIVNTTLELVVSESQYISFRSRSASSSETIFCYVMGYICDAYKLDYD